LVASIISEARFGILDEFPILQVSMFTSANYPPDKYPLIITPNMCVNVRGDTQRIHRYPLLDPTLAVESIPEVPGASKAYLKVENGSRGGK
jgi:hypothetical protein